MRKGKAAKALVTLLMAIATSTAATQSGSSLNQGLKSASSKPAAPQNTPTRQSRRGPGDGIKVHGHWVIEVRNPDGSVASRTEFDNSLVPNGAAVLGSLLSRNSVPARWAIAMASSTLTGFCDSGTPGSPATCDLEEPTVGCGQNGSTVCPPNVSANLTVTYSTPNVVMQGTAVASVDSNVGVVRSFLGFCSRGGLLISSPLVCTDDLAAVGNQARTAFTSATLTTPIALVAGQTVSVTFTLSFS